MEKQENQLDFDKYFICPLCAYKIEWDELVCGKWIPSEIKDTICEDLCSIEKVIEKMNHNTSLHTYCEEIKYNIEGIKNNHDFSDFMNFAPTLYYCEGCHEIIMLKEYEIIYPINDRIVPNKDLPNKIANNYKEALMHCHNSPVSFAAMIRTTMESLLKYITQSDKKSNNDMINYLFENKKIDEITKEALHLIREIGNNMHSGEAINMSYAQRIFLLEIINELAKKFITDKKKIEEIYSLLPEKAKRENREK